MVQKPWVRWALGAFFVAFLIFLYGPLIVMFILSFQGEQGGATFPLQGISLHWWKDLFSARSAGIREAAVRSLIMGGITAALTAVFSTMLAMALRKKFRGSGAVFYAVVLALMTPGILLGLGVSLLWRLAGWQPYWLTTGLGVHVTWALPFGFLVMVAVMNRFDKSVEEAARDLGASNARTFLEVVLPLIWTGIFGAALFGFTLSWNEFERSVLVIPEATLPLQIFAMATVEIIRPSIYALGTLTTLITFVIVAVYCVASGLIRPRFPWRRRSPSADSAGS